MENAAKYFAPSAADGLNSDSINSILADPEGNPFEIDLPDTTIDIKDLAELAGDLRSKYETCEQVYLWACKKLGCTPVTPFIRNINSEICNLDNYGLGEKGTKALAVSLIINTKIIRLQLASNCTGYAGAFCICHMLTENCFITEIVLDSNNLGSRGAAYISKLLEDNRSIKYVSLRNNNFEDNDAQYLYDGIKNNLTLEYLDLSENSFCETPMLGQLINQNESLKTMKLAWNKLRLDGIKSVIGGLKENVSLKHIDLSWNGIETRHCVELADVLIANNTLQHLNINNNRIDAVGAQSLCRGLQNNESLMYLHINGNPIGEQGFSSLISAIISNTRNTLEFVEYPKLDFPTKETIALMNELYQMKKSSQSDHNFQFHC